MTHEWTRGDYTISTDPRRLDLDVIHGFLTRSYWAEGRSRERVALSIAHSLPFGLYHPSGQVGFARVVTDGVTFGWVCDVFVDEAERGRGVGDLLMGTIATDPRLVGLRRLALATRDAHGLYERHGFGPLVNPERWMERRRP